MREKARHVEASKLFNAKLEGKIEGKLEGKIEGKKDLLLSLLSKKFGVLPENVETIINNIDNVDTVQKIVDSIFDINSPEEVIEIIG